MQQLGPRRLLLPTSTVTTKLQVMTACYKDNPVYQQHENRELFIDMNSHSLKIAFAIVPCCHWWLMLVQGEPTWWSRPELSRAAAPMIVSLGDSADDALYTTQQVEDWRHLVTFPVESTVQSM